MDISSESESVCTYVPGISADAPGRLKSPLSIYLPKSVTTSFFFYEISSLVPLHDNDFFFLSLSRLDSNQIQIRKSNHPTAQSIVPIVSYYRTYLLVFIYLCAEQKPRNRRLVAEKKNSKHRTEFFSKLYLSRARQFFVLQRSHYFLS